MPAYGKKNGLKNSRPLYFLFKKKKDPLKISCYIRVPQLGCLHTTSGAERRRAERQRAIIMSFDIPM